MTWQCFWMEPVWEAEQGLRRHASSGSGASDCSNGYHNAHVFLEQRIPVGIKTDDDGRKSWDYVQGDFTDHNDPRWPVKCDHCDYEFTENDNWQDWTEPLYRRTDNGQERVLHWNMIPSNAPTAEPGAMWHSWWHEGWVEGGGGILSLNPDRPKDGIVLSVRCPYMDDRISKGGQDWCVDHGSSSGGYWTRVGDPRNPPSLTVTPSIAIGMPTDSGYYHGFLQAGVLTDHLG